MTAGSAAEDAVGGARRGGRRHGGDRRRGGSRHGDRRSGGQNGSGAGLLSAAVAATAVLFALPAAYLAWASLSLGGDLLGVVSSPDVLAPLARSIVLAVSCAAACMVLGTALALVVARTDVLGRRALRVAVALPLAVPSYVGATALVTATGPGGLLPALPRPEGFAGAFGVLTVLSYPYVYLLVLARLGRVSRSHEEASRLLGASRWRTLVHVVLPPLRQPAAAGGLLVLLYVLSDFGAVALLRYDTITRAIYASRLLDRATSVTLGLFLAVLAIAVAAAARSATGAPPGPRPAAPPQRARLGWARLPVAVASWGVVAAGVGLPVAVFALWAVRGSTTVGVGYSGLGDSLGFLVAPALGSSAAASVAAAVTVAVVLPLAVQSVRRPGSLTRVATALVTSVFALPGLLVALALVFATVGAPGPLGAVYQTFGLLVLGYVLHFGAQGLRSAQAAVAAVPVRLDEAARTLGASPRRRFLSVDLPLVAPGLLAGGGLVLLSTLKELPATLLLAPTGFETLATTIFLAAEDGFFAEVGVSSLALLALSALLTWVLVLRPQLGPSAGRPGEPGRAGRGGPGRAGRGGPGRASGSREGRSRG